MAFAQRPAAGAEMDRNCSFAHSSRHAPVKDLLQPCPEEKRKHRKTCLVLSPSSYFMDVKCQESYKITTVLSHAHTVVLCVSCSTVPCQPTAGKARPVEECSFRRKQHENTLNQDEWKSSQ
ncbi:small ribosomal subunit protein eS27-like [Cynocephalus volans]|uniref:small ribosomal subunit protein eS27-like n=1 Tax=Cynocephalus volans TaxID=110931 RepID=UPI002FC92984